MCVCVFYVCIICMKSIRNLLQNGHEFEQTLGGSEGQRSLACCSPWGCKESDMTERLNNNNRTELHSPLC